MVPPPRRNPLTGGHDDDSNMVIRSITPLPLPASASMLIMNRETSASFNTSSTIGTNNSNAGVGLSRSQASEAFRRSRTGPIPFDTQEVSVRNMDATANVPLPSSSTSSPKTRNMLEEEIRLLRRRLADHERRQPHMENTIQLLQKQLRVSQDTAATVTARDIRPGSQYRQEIAELKQALAEKDEIIQERDRAIGNMMQHCSKHPSAPPASPNTTQDTSVCSSMAMMMTEDEQSDTSSSKGGTGDSGNGKSHVAAASRRNGATNDAATLQAQVSRLKSQNDHYVGLLDMYEEELEALRAAKARSNHEVQALRQRLAASTKLQNSERQQAATCRRESRLLENQVVALKREMRQVRSAAAATAAVASSTSASDGEEKKEDDAGMPLHRGGFEGPNRSRREIELENELVNVKKSLVASEGEIKKLRDSLWLAKLQSENAQDLGDKLDQARSSGEAAKAAAAEAEKLVQRREVQLRQKNVVIGQLTAEIRSQESKLVTLENTNSNLERKSWNVTRSVSFAGDDGKHRTEENKSVDTLRLQLKASRDETMDLREQLQERSKELVDVRRSIDEKNKEVEAEKTQTRKILDELDTLRGDLRVKCATKERLQQDLEHAVSVKRAMEDTIADQTLRIHDLELTRSQLQESLILARNAQLETEEKLAVKSAECRRLALSLEKDGERIQDVERQLSKKTAAVEAAGVSQREVVCLNEELDATRHQATDREAEIASLESAKESLGRSLELVLATQPPRESKTTDTTRDSCTRISMELEEKQLSVEEVQRNILGCEEDNKQLQIELDVAKEQLAILKEQHTSLEESCKEVGELRRTLESLQNENSHLKGETKLNAEKLIRILQETAAKESKIKDLSDQLQDRSGNLVAARQDIDEQNVKISHLEEISRRSSDEVKELQQELAALKESRSILDQDLQRRVAELQATRLQLEERESDVDAIEAAKKSSSQALEDACRQMEEKDKKIKDLETKTRELSNHIATVKNDLDVKDERIAALENDLQSRSENLVRERQQVMQLERSNGSAELIRLQQDHDAVTRECIRLKKENESLSEEITRIQEECSELKALRVKLESSPEEVGRVQRALEHAKQEHARLEDKPQYDEPENSTKPIMEKNKALIRENQSLSSKVQTLTAEITDLKLIKSNLNDESYFAQQLEEARVEHARSLASLSMNSQVTIDTLRKDLAASREKCAEEVAHLTASLSSLQDENSELKRQYGHGNLRDQQVFALEHTLHAQENTVDRLKAELQQLQINMTRGAVERRSEMEQLRSEIMEKENLISTKNRELESVLMELDETKAKHDTEVQRLYDKIQHLETESPLGKSLRDLQKANVVIDVKERLESLKVINVELKEENIKLASRLERAAIKVKSIEAEKKIAEETERECLQLRVRVKEMESLFEEQCKLSKKTDNKNIKTESVKKEKAEKRGFIGKLKRKNGSGKRQVPSILYIDPCTPPIEEELLSHTGESVC